MKKYICKKCKWVYDPEIGDPVGGIPPGVAFTHLPDSWVCPQCGADKSKFVELGCANKK